MAVAEHLRWCKLRNLRAGTIEQRRRALTRLECALAPTPLIDATERQLADWYAALADVVQPESRATELSHVRQFYRWCVLDGRRADDPTRRLMRPRIGRRVPRPISEGDLEIALAGASDRVRPWLVLAGFCGLRAMEISQLRREDVMDRQTSPVIMIIDGKGGKDRVVPLAPLVIRELYRQDLPARGHLFLRFDGQPGPLPPHAISKYANTALRSLGIEATLHQLRHRFATKTYEAIGDLRVVQELLGHSSPTTTSSYAAHSEAKAVSAVMAVADAWQRSAA